MNPRILPYGLLALASLCFGHIPYAQGWELVGQTSTKDAAYFLPSSALKLPDDKIQYSVMVVFAQPRQIGSSTVIRGVEKHTGSCTGTGMDYEIQNFITKEEKIEPGEGRGMYVISPGTVHSNAREVACAFISGGTEKMTLVLNRIRGEVEAKIAESAAARIDADQKAAAATAMIAGATTSAFPKLEPKVSPAQSRLKKSAQPDKAKSVEQPAVGTSEQPLSYFDQEARAYVEASKHIDSRQSAAVRNAFETYWKRRLEIADRIDKGQISRETAIELVSTYEKQATSEIESANREFARAEAQAQSERDKARALHAQQAAQSQAIEAQLQAQAHAQAQAESEAKKQQLFDFGMKLLFPPPPPRPVMCNSWVNGRMIQTTCR